MKVALIYNLKRFHEEFPLDYFSEFDTEETVLAIAQALKKNGHYLILLEADAGLPGNLCKNRVDIVFNIAEGRRGPSRESQVPAILDLLGIPYTGSGVLTLALALDKATSKKIFKYEGIPTPEFQLFSPDSPKELNPRLKFPLIVKPNNEGSAKGITVFSVVPDEQSLYKEVERVWRLYNQSALAEEFIEGKEITVAILGNNPPKALAPLEIDFSRTTKDCGEYFYSWRMKEYQGSLGLNPQFYCPARLPQRIQEELMQLALKAHQALGCCDFSRVDIRLNQENSPFVLEVNPLPGLDPKQSNFTFICNCCRIPYEELIETILQSARQRYGIDTKQRGGQVVYTNPQPGHG